MTHKDNETYRCYSDRWVDQKTGTGLTGTGVDMPAVGINGSDKEGKG